MTSLDPIVRNAVILAATFDRMTAMFRWLVNYNLLKHNYSVDKNHTKSPSQVPFAIATNSAIER